MVFDLKKNIEVLWDLFLSFVLLPLVAAIFGVVLSALCGRGRFSTAECINAFFCVPRGIEDKGPGTGTQKTHVSLCKS